MKNIVMVLALLLIMPQSWARSNALPDQVVKQMTDGLLRKLQAKSAYLKKNPGQVKSFAHSLIADIAPKLDLPRMSWSIVGKTWRTATKDQKRGFMREFKAMLVNTYAKSLLKYTNQKITYNPYRHIPGRKNAIVSGYFKPSSGAPVPISYKLFNSKKYGWRIYDVNVAGVSLVTSYKSSFASTLRKSGMSGLVQTLKNKNAKK